jgi:hypothetical protein
MTRKRVEHQPTKNQQPETLGGLPVRTDLRAGLSWDDLDDAASSLWDQLTGTVSNVVNSITGNKPAA